MILAIRLKLIYIGFYMLLLTACYKAPRLDDPQLKAIETDGWERYLFENNRTEEADLSFDPHEIVKTAKDSDGSTLLFEKYSSGGTQVHRLRRNSVEIDFVCKTYDWWSTISNMSNGDFISTNDYSNWRYGDAFKITTDRDEKLYYPYFIYTSYSNDREIDYLEDFTVFEDDQQTIWLITKYNFFRQVSALAEHDTVLFEQVDIELGGSSSQNHPLKIDGGVVLYNDRGDISILKNGETISLPKLPTMVNQCQYSTDNILYCSTTGNKLYRFDGYAWQEIQVELEDKSITDINRFYIDSKNNIWVHTDDYFMKQTDKKWVDMSKYVEMNIDRYNSAPFIFEQDGYIYVLFDNRYFRTKN